MAVIVTASRPRATTASIAMTDPTMASTLPTMCVMLLNRSPAYMGGI